MKTKSDILWIAWERQRRSTTLAKELNADLYQLISNKTRAIRYLSLGFQTLKILYQNDYKYIFVQNPSIFLALLIVSVKKFFNNPSVIIDTHTLYLKLTSALRLLFYIAQKIVFEYSDLTIVSNKYLKREYEQKYPKGKYFVLPDKIPEFDYKIKKLSLHTNILYICTYAVDEPFLAVFEAAGKRNDITIYVTGNFDKLTGKQIERKPENVILTGFVSEEEYAKLLNSVDIVMALTTIDHCMLCGAYEAVSVEKPLILSNKKALIKYFNQGVVHTSNNSNDISRAIGYVIKNKQQLSVDIRELKRQRNNEWHLQWQKMMEKIKL